MSKKAKNKKAAEMKVLKTDVVISRVAMKDFDDLSKEIQDAFQIWVKSVTEIGLKATGDTGYKHEHLKGKRQGQRSARLNKSFRVIFTVKNGAVQIVTVEEINNHKY